MQENRTSGAAAAQSGMRKGKPWFGCLQAYFLYFLAYSVLGWCYEVFLEVVVYLWGFSNRGFLWGPYCPVYGFGALLLLLCLRGVMKRRLLWGRVCVTPAVVFVAIVVLTTVLELLTSYLLEWTTGGWLWDYSSYTIQFEGRICLSASLRFGVAGMLVLYVLQPLLERAVTRLGERRRAVLFAVLFGLFLLDFILRIT